jgi:hypothetical protein
MRNRNIKLAQASCGNDLISYLTFYLDRLGGVSSNASSIVTISDHLGSRAKQRFPDQLVYGEHKPPSFGLDTLSEHVH